MPSEQDSMALVAIVIAIIAFFVTVSQFLVQVFGTIEGLRRCRQSVIGDWTTLAKPHWRWREFRFETRYQTPHIHLTSIDDRISGAIALRNDGESRRLSYSRKTSAPNETTGELASWLTLIDQLHEVHSLYYSSNDRSSQDLVGPIDGLMCKMTPPFITIRLRSWDFQPPEIVRPFASSTVGDIVALGHRLGMSWSEIRPGDGVMRAEGNGHTLTSTSIRGLGILFQYTFDRAVIEKNQSSYTSHLTIPSDEADKFGFGILPGYSDLGLPDIIFGETNEIKMVEKARYQLETDFFPYPRSDFETHHRNPDRISGFADLTSMAAPFMPISKSSVNRLISHPYRNSNYSPLLSVGGFAVFRHHLRTQYKVSAGNSKQTKNAYTSYMDLNAAYVAYNPRRGNLFWESGPRFPDRLGAPIGNEHKFLEHIRATWKWTTEYFKDLEKIYDAPGHQFRYIDLVAAHVAQDYCYSELSKNDGKSGSESYDERVVASSKDQGRLSSAQLMHLYIRRLEKIVDKMTQGGHNKNLDRSVIIEAWWTMMLRAICWNRSVEFAFGPQSPDWKPVPSSLYGSKIPVYIA